MAESSARQTRNPAVPGSSPALASCCFKSCYVVFELFVFSVFTDCKALWITKRKAALYKCTLLLLLLFLDLSAFSRVN